MATTKELHAEFEEVNSLKDLAEVYGEIAAFRMKKIRGYVLSNRRFLDAINSIFKSTLATYAQKLSYLVRAGKIKEGGKVTFLAHNGKVVSVLISANTGFYGDVVRETFNKFISDVRSENFEVTIIGKLGRNLFVEEEPNRPYTFFELPDFGVDQAKISEAISHLVQYEEIRVYYGKFISVVTQKPTTFSISAGTPVSGSMVAPEVNYIFEPSIEKILTFFETQIFASLFDQSIRESQLAKFASRILAMDKASENVGLRLEQLRLQQLRTVHNVANRKQTNSLSSAVFSE